MTTKGIGLLALAATCLSSLVAPLSPVAPYGCVYPQFKQFSYLIAPPPRLFSMASHKASAAPQKRF